MSESCKAGTLPTRFFVHRAHLIDPHVFSSIVRRASLSLNANCCRADRKKLTATSTKAQQLPQTKTEITTPSSEFTIDVPMQAKVAVTMPERKPSLLFEVINNAWPISSERVENLGITHKRCHFSNEAVSIKPITAVPGIGQKYGQLLADHGFVYARQLLGYYMMLKDSEMFRKWLEYRFHIPKFRAAEAADALNELIRRTL